LLLLRDEGESAHTERKKREECRIARRNAYASSTSQGRNGAGKEYPLFHGVWWTQTNTRGGKTSFRRRTVCGVAFQLVKKKRSTRIDRFTWELRRQTTEKEGRSGRIGQPSAKTQELEKLGGESSVEDTTKKRGSTQFRGRRKNIDSSNWERRRVHPIPGSRLIHEGGTINSRKRKKRGSVRLVLQGEKVRENPKGQKKKKQLGKKGDLFKVGWKYEALAMAMEGRGCQEERTD